MTDVNLVVAFAAGVLSLLSPCSALLLPSFFAYAFASRRLLLRRTAAFYVGLLVTLVPLGMGVGFASSLFYGHRPVLIAVTGWALVVLGVAQALGGFAMPFAGRLQTWSGRVGGTGTVSLVLLGAVYGLAGFCSGPVLGAILTVAATQGTADGGGFLLAVYALGMAAPLFLLAALWDRFDLGARRWVRGRPVRIGPITTHTTSLASGVLFVAIGVLFLRYDGTAGITGVLGLGDTTGLESAAQDAVSRWTVDVPGWAVPGAIGVVAAGVALLRARAPKPAARADHTGE